MGSAKYSAFQECSHKNFSCGSNNPNDYYYKSRKELLDTIDSIGILVIKKKVTPKEAYGFLTNYLNQKIIEEQQQAKRAGAALAIMAVGVAGISCANNGGCGGGGNSYGYNAYDGSCECPKDIANDGSICGARSAYSRTGGATPACPFNRI